MEFRNTGMGKACGQDSPKARGPSALEGSARGPQGSARTGALSLSGGSSVDRGGLRFKMRGLSFSAIVISKLDWGVGLGGLCMGRKTQKSFTLLALPHYSPAPPILPSCSQFYLLAPTCLRLLLVLSSIDSLSSRILCIWLRM